MVIEKFELKDSLGKCDRICNPNQLNILELSPNTVSWYYNSLYHEVKNDNKLLALLLTDKEQIAIIEDLTSKKDNVAYIVNGDNKKIWDISFIFREKNKNFGTVFFNDSYYIKNELYYFVIINSTDFRFSFNPNNGSMGKLIESR